MLRVVLADHVEQRAAALSKALAQHGCEVVALLPSSGALEQCVRQHAPDAVLTEMQSEGGDSISDVRLLMREHPCPVVMYAGAKDSDAIARAIDAGVSAYVTEDIRARDLRQVVELAISRFRKYKSLTDELQQARDQLEERKLVDKAKALLMKHNGLDELAAHKTLLQIAMNQRITLRDAANNVVALMVALPPT